MPRKISAGPAWLNYSSTSRKHELDVEKAKIIVRIFRESANGIGAFVLASRLNKDRVPNIGSSPIWLRSSISKILKNRAVLGEYKKTVRVGNKDVPIGEPIHNFYPQIVDHRLFNAAQIAIRANLENRGRKGSHFVNLFAGLLFCGFCNNRMKLEGGSKRRSLICQTYFASKTCCRTNWNYNEFEKKVLNIIEQKDEVDPTTPAISTLSSILKADTKNDVYESRANQNRLMRLCIEAMSLFSTEAEDGQFYSYIDAFSRTVKITFLDSTVLEINW